MPSLPLVNVNALPYVESLESRLTSNIDLVVIHCTELPDLAMARKYGEQVHYPETGTGNSGHFYIERNGTIEQWVPVDRVAHHVRNFNKNSLGIELVNRGRYPQWFSSRHQLMQEPYPPEQVDALLHLLKTLSEQLPSLSLISGHSTLDKSLVQATDNSLEKVYRKQDPGPLFPWPDVLAETSLVWFEPENDL